MSSHFFASQFEFNGLRHHRLEQSPQNVTPTHVKQRLTLPNDLGAALLECYSRGQQLFTRLYHIQSGAFAWYSVELLADAIPEKAAVAVPSRLDTRGETSDA